MTLLTTSVALAAVLTLPVATVAGTPLVEGSTTTARLSVPYPGHSVPFDLTARAASADPAELSLVVDGGDGPLASGPDALQLVLTDAAGTVLAAGTAQELATAPVPLGTLTGTPITLHGTATLPRTAGDEYQGVGMSLTLTLTATQELAGDGDRDGGALAITGAEVAALAAAAALLVAVGLWLAAIRRRREEETR